MKTLKHFCVVVFISQLSFAQSIVIGTGATIDVGSGADICATTYGNISGNLTGSGTQCGQSPLPVELTSFTATVKNNDVNLKWETETEVDNYGFDIERSVEEETWQKIGFVEGNGNSNSPKSYSFTDRIPVGGSKFLYRLKQIDTDGDFEYSDVVEVEIIPGEFVLYQNYPNPFNPATTIKFQIPVRSNVLIGIYDLLGSEVLKLLDEEKEAGTYKISFNAQSLATGTYLYRIIAGSFVETRKMVLMK